MDVFGDGSGVVMGRMTTTLFGYHPCGVPLKDDQPAGAAAQPGPAKRFALWLPMLERTVQVGSFDTLAEAEKARGHMIEAGAGGVTIVDAGAPDGDAMAGQVGLPMGVRDAS